MHAVASRIAPHCRIFTIAFSPKQHLDGQRDRHTAVERTGSKRGTVPILMTIITETAHFGPDQHKVPAVPLGFINSCKPCPYSKISVGAVHNLINFGLYCKSPTWIRILTRRYLLIYHTKIATHQICDYRPYGSCRRSCTLRFIPEQRL